MCPRSLFQHGALHMLGFRHHGVLCLLHSLCVDFQWYDALSPAGEPSETGVEVIPRIFRHLLWSAFGDYLRNRAQRAEFVGLWPGALELFANVAACAGAKFVEEKTQVAWLNILTNEFHDEF